MSPAPPDLVVYALGHVDELTRWPLADWELLVRQARRADLLSRIAVLLERRGLIEQVPAAPRVHLQASHLVAQAQHNEVRHEVELLRLALAPTGLPLLLLKGAGYVAAGLPPATGRLFSDIDLLVPKAQLSEVEASLMMNGWMSSHHSAYDQRYYREWMHELPPMEHMRRHTVIDVHHTILPETARLKPDAAKLLAAARPVPGFIGVKVLAPTDMVLHSMTHLFHNDDLSHGLRDLSDLDLLLRHFAPTPGFYGELVERARELDLARPLHYGLRCAHRILGTPVPEHTLVDAAGAAPAWPWSALMDALWWRSLRSQHSTVAPPFTATALFLLYLRAHWLRMPTWLLARHLAIKAWQRSWPRKETAG